MANEKMSNVDQDIGENSIIANANVKDSHTKEKKRRGIFSQIWNGLFRTRADDFEKRLQNISKEEVTVMARLNLRSQFWRRWATRLIILSISVEIIAVGFAIIMTRSLELNWKMRALRVLPMFLFPVLYFLAYSTLRSLRTMYDLKDQKTLERLRAERKSKIDELKEKTNYYNTQQLIQRYDTDPAAKAAAASVLASKLGADSGLKVFLEGSGSGSGEGGMSSEVEVMKSSGVRNRKHRNSGSPPASRCNEDEGEDVDMAIQERDENVETRSTAADGGWLARFVALLMADDPRQSYALVCSNCHRHNGLAKEEELAYITYYCPHCHALNNPKQQTLSEAVAQLNSSDGSLTDQTN